MEFADFNQVVLLLNPCLGPSMWSLHVLSVCVGSDSTMVEVGMVKA